VSSVCLPAGKSAPSGAVRPARDVRTTRFISCEYHLTGPSQLSACSRDTTHRVVIDDAEPGRFHRVVGIQHYDDCIALMKKDRRFECVKLACLQTRKEFADACEAMTGLIPGHVRGNDPILPLDSW